MKAKTLGLMGIFAALMTGCSLESVNPDKCPDDLNKLEPGVCGCGITDEDTDGDHFYDCEDECPDDPNKSEKGACGCGISDDDLDNNTIPDCIDAEADLCPEDENKTLPGICGCGVEDVDTDGDGTYDCADACPEDPAKQEVGYCGCGVEDIDANNNTIPDCIEEKADLCPEDENKTLPGICGCGVEDLDTDGDGTADCYDICPEDADKLHPGVCGCGVSDIDSDNDGRPDCVDGCPNDGTKLWDGVCGCGIPDTDSDGDGVADCKDGCVDDPEKTVPGVCGCGVPDSGDNILDGDGDGVINCLDQCPDNPDKVIKGDVECDDNDSDKDGVYDSLDSCPFNPEVTSGKTGIDCYYMEEDGKRIFTIYSAADFKVLEEEVNKIKPADLFGMQCHTPGAILCHDSGNSSEYTACEPLSSDYFGDDETLVQRVYAWSLGGCAGNQVCVNAEGAMTEEDVCTGGDVSVEPACHDTGESAPGAVGDCCSNDALSASYFADQCTGTDMLSCVNGKVEKKVCHGGCSVSEGLVTCQICKGTGVSSGGAPGDCCTDDYEETCHENGKLVCHNGVVVQERCLGSCIDATEKYDLICLEPLKASEEDFKLYVRVMRDIDMSGIVAAKDTEVGCAGIWDSIDLYETHFDGNGKTITFTSGGRSCGMTTPLFDQVVSSQIEDLNLKYNMRGSASSALSNYLVMSGVSNVHYDGDISVGFSVLGESAGTGFGAMAKYSAYSVFDRISMKGSSVSYAGKYYGLLAHGEMVTIHQAEVLTEDLNCLSGYCAGSFGFITDGMLRDLTVNIPKVSYGIAEMTAGIMFLLNTRLEDYDFKLDSVTQDSTLGGSFAGAIFASEGVNIVDVKHEVTSMDIITGGSSFGSVGGSIKNVTSKAGTLKSENNSIYGLFDDSNGQIENVQFEADTVEAKNGYAYGFGGYLSASLKDVKSTIKTVKSENSVAMGFCSSLSGSSSQNITSQVTTVDGYYVYGFSSGVNGTVNNVQSTVGTVKADYSVYGFTSSLYARMTDVKNHITKIESSSMYGGVYGFANYHTGSINGLEHRVDEIIISKPNNSVAVYPVFYTVQLNYSSYGFSLKNANIDIGTVITGGYVYGLGYRHSCRNGAGDIVGLRYHADKLVSKNGIAYGMYYEVESLELSDAAIRIDHLQGGNGVSMIGYMNYYSQDYTNKFTDVAVYADMYAMNPSSAYGFIQLHKVYSGNSSYTSRFNRVAVSNRISSYTASQLNSDGIATSGTVLHNRSHVLYSVNYTGYNIVPTNMYWLRRDSSDFAYRSNDTSENETKFTPYTTTNGMTITGSLNNAHGGTVWIPLLIEEESNEFYIPWLNNL